MTDADVSHTSGFVVSGSLSIIIDYVSRILNIAQHYYPTITLIFFLVHETICPFVSISRYYVSFICEKEINSIKRLLYTCKLFLESFSSLSNLCFAQWWVHSHNCILLCCKPVSWNV